MNETYNTAEAAFSLQVDWLQAMKEAKTPLRVYIVPGAFSAIVSKEQTMSITAREEILLNLAEIPEHLPERSLAHAMEVVAVVPATYPDDHMALATQWGMLMTLAGAEGNNPALQPFMVAGGLITLGGKAPLPTTMTLMDPYRPLPLMITHPGGVGFQPDCDKPRNDKLPEASSHLEKQLSPGCNIHSTKISEISQALDQDMDVLDFLAEIESRGL